MDLNHDTGHAVEGWAHVVQSIQTVLSTRVNSRVFRREFGSEVPALVDAPLNDAGLLALHVAVAEALERWEPRFELTDIGHEANADGVLLFTLMGTYRPDAHRGDLSTAEGSTRTVRMTRDRVENWSVAA